MSRALSSFKPSVRLSLSALLAAVLTSALAASAASAAPPGRAYERVTPTGKGGGEVASVWHARPAGGGVSFAGFAPFDNSGGGAALISEYSGIRGASGWTVVDRHPVTLGQAGFLGIIAPQGLTDD